MDDEAFEAGDGRFQALPNPVREDFAGGVGEAVDVVEAVVIELLEEGSEVAFEFGEVDDEAGARIEGALDDEANAEGVSVEAGAGMSFGEGGQEVGGLEGVFDEGLGAHSVDDGRGNPRWGRAESAGAAEFGSLRLKVSGGWCPSILRR